MALKESEISTNFDYYTPTVQEGASDFAVQTPEFLAGNKYFQSLVKMCLRSFDENQQGSKGAKSIESRIQVFTNGFKPFSPMQPSRNRFFIVSQQGSVEIPEDDAPHYKNGSQKEGIQLVREVEPVKSKFETEAKAVIAQYCTDLVDPKTGDLLEGREQDWFNMVEIAPTLIKILTSRDNYISMVQKSDALGIVKSALHLARNPNASINLSIGFGGSDAPYSPARLPAYAIPALRIAEQIKDFYSDRLQRKMRDAAVQELFEFNDAVRAFYAAQPASKEEKKALSAELKPDENGDYSNLTASMRQDVLSKYSISEEPVKVHLFIADEAAIAINHNNMDPEQVRLRSVENMATLKDHVETYHQRVKDVVDYSMDKPWDSKPHTRITIEYLADVLRRSQDPSIQETLRILGKLGEGRGGENGAERAAEYAAMHPLGFGDRLDLPYVSYLPRKAEDREISFTIGGRTEKHFCAVRKYLSQNADADGFIGFISQKLEDGSRDDQAALAGMIPILERWKSLINYARERSYSNRDSSLPRPDYPLIGAMLITSIAKHPTYYLTEFDQPNSLEPDEYDRYLRQKESYFSDQNDDALREAVYWSVVEDMNALRKAQGREFVLGK